MQKVVQSSASYRFESLFTAQFFVLRNYLCGNDGSYDIWFNQFLIRRQLELSFAKQEVLNNMSACNHACNLLGSIS